MATATRERLTINQVISAIINEVVVEIDGRNYYITKMQYHREFRDMHVLYLEDMYGHPEKFITKLDS